MEKVEYKIVDMQESTMGLVPVIEASDGKRYVPNPFISGVWVEELDG